MSAELATIEQSPADEWKPLIMDAMPQRFGVRFGTLLTDVQTAWETLDNPPCSSVAAAVIEMANREELEINGQVIKRGPNAVQ